MQEAGGLGAPIAGFSQRDEGVVFAARGGVAGPPATGSPLAVEQGLIALAATLTATIHSG